MNRTGYVFFVAGRGKIISSSIDNCVKSGGNWEHFSLNASTLNRCDWPSAYSWMGLNDNTNDDNVIIISSILKHQQRQLQQLIFVSVHAICFSQNNSFITIQLHHFFPRMKWLFAAFSTLWIIKHISQRWWWSNEATFHLGINWGSTIWDSEKHHNSEWR